jgi:hypothetical protein
MQLDILFNFLLLVPLQLFLRYSFLEKLYFLEPSIFLKINILPLHCKSPSINIYWIPYFCTKFRLQRDCNFYEKSDILLLLTLRYLKKLYVGRWMDNYKEFAWFDSCTQCLLFIKQLSELICITLMDSCIVLFFSLQITIIPITFNTYWKPSDLEKCEILRPCYTSKLTN